MNKDILKGKWTELEGKVKTQWGKLTDNDITTINGNYDQLEGKLQQLYGYKKEQANKEITTFLTKNGVATDDDAL
ncbi:MAG: CsbD family protein [Pseudomonadota bacterium]